MEQPQDHTYSPHVGSGSPGRNSKAFNEIAETEVMWVKLRRTYADYKKAHPQGDLCQRCAGINWTGLLYDSDDRFYVDLFSVPETIQELSASSCPLCRLMSSDQMFGKDPDGTLSVYNAYNDVLYLEHHDEHSWNRYAPCLELRSGHFYRKYILQNVCTSTQFYLLRKLDSEVIDYEILRHWLRYCKCHHTKCTQTYDSIIPGLRVIDCTTETVVHAPEDTTFHYVALSYVWGGTKSSGKDQDEFPATIRDAITVTIRLGYRYLWVDQYVCDLTLLKACRTN
jgi:hypothetical protein